MSILEMRTVGNSGWIGHSGLDQNKTKVFYQNVLGWTINGMPMQDGSSYSAAAYFTLADVDASLEKAEAKGAEATQPAMDMPGVERKANLVDLQGAKFALITKESMAS